MKIRIWTVAPGALLLSMPAALPAFAHGISEVDQLRMVESGFVHYIALGASHMLTGYDHLLFLSGKFLAANFTGK